MEKSEGSEDVPSAEGVDSRDVKKLPPALRELVEQLREMPFEAGDPHPRQVPGGGLVGGG